MEQASFANNTSLLGNAYFTTVISELQAKVDTSVYTEL